jgi:phenylacetate-CoA ligase
MSFGFTIAGECYGFMMVENGAMVANVGSRSTLATPGRTADAISRLKPGFVVGAPIDLLAWMKIIKEDHSEVYEDVLDELSIFLSSAELCSRSRQKAIEKHFNLLQIDSYATVEGFFAVACPCGSKHLLPLYLAELFDENLNKIGSYGRGRLVFTSLAKRSTPLVRYVLDDLVTIKKSENCPFGFDTDIIPHGRYELSVRINDELLNVEDFEEEIFQEGLFGDYRVRLFDNNKAEIILEDYAAPNGAAKLVEERFRDRFGLQAKAELKPYGFLTPYREPRTAKAILKVEDMRSCSKQDVPEVL